MSWWGLFTVLIRPLAGEGWWEFLERAYNFEMPWLMLWVHGPRISVTSLYAAVGLGDFGVPLPTVRAVIGGVEMLLGVCCVVVKVAFFLFVYLWKLGTEWFYVPAQVYGA